MRTLATVLVTIAVAPTFAQRATTGPATLVTLRGVVATANDVPLPRVRVVEIAVSQQISVHSLAFLGRRDEGC